MRERLSRCFLILIALAGVAGLSVQRVVAVRTGLRNGVAAKSKMAGTKQ